MTARSITAMNATLAAREAELERMLAAAADQLPPAAERTHYYRIERRRVTVTKKGTKETWLTVEHAQLTPSAAEKLMASKYAGPEYRLVDLVTY